MGGRGGREEREREKEKERGGGVVGEREGAVGKGGEGEERWRG